MGDDAPGNPEIPSALDERKLRMKLMDTEIQQRLQQIELATKQFELEQRRAWWQGITAAFAAGAGTIVALAAVVRLVWLRS